jgi:protein-tyrosine phosphatase
MIDCHTHLLPDMDDGSPSMEHSILALQQMAQGGIKSVVCTAHYMRGKYSYSHENYRYRFNELESEIKHQNIPITLYPGAEVYLAPGIVEDIISNKLTLAESSYVLFETDLNGFPHDMQKNIYELLRRGFRPILAHAERYSSVMRKSHEARELINRNIYIQINAASILGGYGERVKDTVWKMLNKGWVHFLGSDHHARSDYTAFFKAKEKIEEYVDKYTANLLTQAYPQLMLNNEKVPYDYVIVHKAPHKKRRLKLFKSLGL